MGNVHCGDPVILANKSIIENARVLCAGSIEGHGKHQLSKEALSVGGTLRLSRLMSAFDPKRTLVIEI
jgi:hypothetical protein